MSDVVIKCLEGIANENKIIRDQAEQQLATFVHQQGYSPTLAQLLVNASVPIHVRQLAGIILKQVVKENWEQTLGSQKPTISEGDKESVKLLLPQSLRDPQYKIRIAGAIAIASIAHWDWPDKWQGLIPSLLDCLGNEDNNLVEGAICCLELFVSGDTFSDQHFNGLISMVFPPLLQLVSGPKEKFNDRIKMRATLVVFHCLEWLSVTKQVDFASHNQAPKSIAPLDILSPMLPQWLSVFHEFLKTPDRATQFYGFKISILQALSSLIQNFPGHIKKQLPLFIETVWTNLNTCFPFYQEMAIKNNRLDEAELLPEESATVYGLEPYVSVLIEVLDSLTSKTKVRPLLLMKLPHLFYLLLGYQQMTEEQVDKYQEDPNEWVGDEDDDTMEFNVRISTKKLIKKLFGAYKTEAIGPFSSALASRLQESVSGQSTNSWKLQESCIYAVGTVSKELLKLTKTEGNTVNANAFDIQSFTKNILLPALQSQLPFLRGRSMWCASNIGRELSLDVIGPFLNAAASSLNNPNEPLPIKIFACWTVGNFGPRLDKNVVVPYLAGLMSGLVKVLDVATKEVLELVLEIFLRLLPISEQVTQANMVDIVQRLLVLWAHNYKDGHLVELVVALFSIIASFPSCNSVLQQCLTSTLLNLIKQYEKRQGTVIETTIDMSACLVMEATWPLHLPLMNEFFPILCHILLNCTDTSILVSGSNALRAFVRSCGTNLISWQAPTGESGLQLILKVIARLLSPQVPDTAAINVGFLIDKVIMTYRDNIASVLDEILAGVLNKLYTVAGPKKGESGGNSLLQGLLMVFVRLIHMDTEQGISFLASKSVAGLSALSFILRLWTEQHESFQGGFKIKMSIVGLSKLFQSSNPNLNNIMVPGDISTVGEGVSTRSKAKRQVFEEHIKLRIFKLLVREHEVICEDKLNEDDQSVSDSIDEEDWGSDDEDLALSAIQYKSTLSDSDHGSSPFAPAEEYAYLDELLDDQIVVREEKEDPDILSDPIFNLNLLEYITAFLRAFSAQNPQALQAFAIVLSAHDRAHLNTIFGSH